ncbi:MAG: hypothetical protein ACHQIG_01430 [Acidimicrobiia bacterium]
MVDLGEKMIETVQPHVPEPVIAVGVLQPAGTWGAMGGDQLSGLVGSLMRRNANKRSSGLGKNSAFRTKVALVAVTASRVYAFNAKGWGPQCKIVDEVGDWDRSDLTITTTQGKMSTKFVIDVVSSGDHFELETNALMGMGGFTTKFADALDAPRDGDG